jgi:MFS family permease
MSSSEMIFVGSGSERKKVLMASSLGTAFEWYDFHLYGTLAPIIAKHYFSGVSEAQAFVFALLTFAAGFVARPFGSIVFGAIGDKVGRKHTFTATIILMALPTLFVGLLPGYETFGLAAPIVLVFLRILQGLASGGEYGGALIFVAEHAPERQRGLDTSWINAMGAVGVILALLVTLSVRTITGEEAFAAWTWRLPFVASVVLFGISVWIRIHLHESPVFEQMKAAGKTTQNPLREAFGQWRNVRTAIFLVLGATAAVGVLAYTSQFYTQFFLSRTLKIDGVTVSTITTFALLLSFPSYIFFGWLSDRIGRKPVILGSILVAALGVQPVFRATTHYGNPQLEIAQSSNPIEIHADARDCSFQFNLVGGGTFDTSCDLLKSYFAGRMVSYINVQTEPGSIAFAKIGGERVPSFDGRQFGRVELKAKQSALVASLDAKMKSAGYPTGAEIPTNRKVVLVLLVTLLIALYAGVYSPIGAWMTELFPARIRYTAISLPYNMGAGWVGGFMPATAFAMVASNGNIYFGLWYPVTVLALSFVVGLLFLPETVGRGTDATRAVI